MISSSPHHETYIFSEAKVSWNSSVEESLLCKNIDEMKDGAHSSLNSLSLSICTLEELIRNIEDVLQTIVQNKLRAVKDKPAA